jgi:hypothetical protein
MFGDHAQFSNRKAVVSSARTRGRGCFVPDEFHVMAEMGFEINTAGGDLESLTSAVFDDRVVALRSAETTFYVGRSCVAAGVGSLRQPACHQQGRYHHH